MQSVAMRIGGRDASSADGRFYEKRNPFTGELIARVPDAGPLDAAAAVGAAAAAFREWSKTPPSKRRAIPSSYVLPISRLSAAASPAAVVAVS